MEDQLGALGLGLNAIVYWNSLYIDAAVKKLAAGGGRLRVQFRPDSPSTPSREARSGLRPSNRSDQLGLGELAVADQHLHGLEPAFPLTAAREHAAR